STPEIIHVLLLRCEEFLRTLLLYSIQCPLGTPTEFLSRGSLRRMINHVFREMDRTTGLSLDRKNDLTGVLTVNRFVAILAGSLESMVTCTSQCHAAFFGRVT